MTTPKQQEKSVFFPAVDYPDDIFQQTTPDESQELGCLLYTSDAADE